MVLVTIELDARHVVAIVLVAFYYSKWVFHYKNSKKGGQQNMNVDKELAFKLWDDIFGNKRFALDCFGTWMCKEAYSNEPVSMKDHLGGSEYYDYSWNVDHIRPKASFQNESDADFLNNFEPIHRQNNLAKSDNYPQFQINNRNYRVVRNEFGGYGIADSLGKRIDWKKDGRHYK